MKKIILFLIPMLFLACSKTPFKENKPLLNSSLVYIYVEENSNFNDTIIDPCYEIRLDSTKIDGCIKSENFIELNNLESKKIIITAIRNDIEKKELIIDLDKGETYFYKISTGSDKFNDFNINRVEKKLALQEISKMNFFNAPKKNKNFLEVISTTTISKIENPISKTDEINKAYKLKVDGLITEKEYQKLKTEILAK